MPTNETLHLLTITFPGEGNDPDVKHHWLCRTRRAALQRLAEWVDDQNRAAMTTEEYDALPSDPDLRIDQYFASTDDRWDITGYPVLEEKADVA